MLSHDFARALLARRNHNLKFVFEAELPGHDEVENHSTYLADDRHREVYRKEYEGEILRYDGENDFLEVALGPIFPGEQGSYCLTPEEVKVVISVLRDLICYRKSLAGRFDLKPVSWKEIQELERRIREESS